MIRENNVPVPAFGARAMSSYETGMDSFYDGFMITPVAFRRRVKANVFKHPPPQGGLNG